jgi:hypothetical protein
MGLFPVTPTLSLGGEKEIRAVIFPKRLPRSRKSRLWFATYKNRDAGGKHDGTAREE